MRCFSIFFPNIRYFLLYIPKNSHKKFPQNIVSLDLKHTNDTLKEYRDRKQNLFSKEMIYKERVLKKEFLTKSFFGYQAHIWYTFII